MNRRQKVRKQAQDEAAKDAKAAAQLEQLRRVYDGLTLGSFTVPGLTQVDAAFGAQIHAYPPMSTIPDEFRQHSGKYQDIVSALFFRGGKLADHGIKFRTGLDHAAAMTAIRAWLCSFAPKQEHKTATVAWALSEWTEPLAQESVS